MLMLHDDFWIWCVCSLIMYIYIPDFVFCYLVMMIFPCRFYILYYRNLRTLWQNTSNTKQTMGHRQSKFLIPGQQNLALWILRSLAYPIWNKLWILSWQHPDLPLILYASGSGGLLERVPLTGVDVVSLDWTVDMGDGRRRLGYDVAVQGNVDPGVLLGQKSS